MLGALLAEDASETVDAKTMEIEDWGTCLSQIICWESSHVGLERSLLETKTLGNSGEQRRTKPGIRRAGPVDLAEIRLDLQRISGSFLNQMSAEVRRPPEFKHITKGRKRN